MQDFPHWTPPGGTLGTLVADAARRAAALRPRLRELERHAAAAPPAPSFAGALRGETVAVIAEIKRRSPSKGDINPGLSVVDQAAAYAGGGAAALSILTEPTRFGGTEADLVAARGAVSLPLLKKDFHVAPVQLVEARALGASAALLIARALSPTSLRALAALGADLGLDVLVEVRDERELDVALSTEAPVVGVNNRNLETLVIDLAAGDRIVPLIPPDRLAVFESGVSTVAEVERAADAGADAVLVGSSVSAAADPVAAVRALCGVARRSRAAVGARR
ncbi:MAG: indole-3-glycerol-phosphate synthase [Gemmatirosa sp.]|nr:indole-3-glycerol-phosphate synthase [Gemmatirosa sp.]